MEPSWFRSRLRSRAVRRETGGAAQVAPPTPPEPLEDPVEKLVQKCMENGKLDMRCGLWRYQIRIESHFVRGGNLFYARTLVRPVIASSVFDCQNLDMRLYGQGKWVDKDTMRTYISAVIAALYTGLQLREVPCGQMVPSSKRTPSERRLDDRFFFDA